MNNQDQINSIIEKSKYNNDMVLCIEGQDERFVEVSMWNEDTETEYYIQVDLQNMDVCEIN